MARTISERQFSKQLGVSLSSVQDRRKSGGLALSVTQDAKGRYRIDSVVGRDEWEASMPLRVPATSDDETLRQWRAARARLAVAQATTAEDELRRRRGELVEVAPLAEKLATIHGTARNKILGIPSRMKQRAPHLTLGDLALLEELLREALEDLATPAAAKGGAARG